MEGNLTLELEQDLLNQVQVIAARRRTTVTELVRSHLRSLVEADITYADTCQRLKDRMQDRPLNVGKQRWTRNELHER